MTLNPTLRSALQAQLRTTTTVGTGLEGKPHADTYARAELLLALVREVYDEIKFERVEGGPGEGSSIGRVTDAALEHVERAMALMHGHENTADPDAQS